MSSTPVNDRWANWSQLTFDWAEVARARYDPRLIFEAGLPDRLLTLTEGQHFDRKSARIAPKQLAETVCAFSNGDASGGLIAVGIEDREIRGFQDVGEAKLNQLMAASHEFCPQAMTHQRIVEAGDRRLLLIYVEYNAYRVVELTDGTVLRRIADRDYRLRPDEIIHLRHDKGEIPFELEVVPDAKGDDLDQNLVAEFADSVRRTENLQHDRSNFDVLVQRRLAQPKGSDIQPRNAAILLFGKDPIRYFPGCKLRFIRYEGVKERTGADLNVIKDEVIEGPIPYLIQRAGDVVGAQLRDYQALQPDGRFALVHEYPHDCVYEAIVNACVHRSYSIRNANIFVRMFDNRLEIESPGGFLPPVTPENIYDQHVPRNPILMDALRYLRLVRCANEGTRRMRHSMTSLGLPSPVFKQVSDNVSKVIVTLQNDIEHRRRWIDKDLSLLVGETLASSLTQEQTRILNYLAENDRITVSDVFRITTVKTWHSARKIMDQLLKKGLVEEVKSYPRDPKAHFVVAKQWRSNPATSQV